MARSLLPALIHLHALFMLLVLAAHVLAHTRAFFTSTRFISSTRSTSLPGRRRASVHGHRGRRGSGGSGGSGSGCGGEKRGGGVPTRLRTLADDEGLELEGDIAERIGRIKAEKPLMELDSSSEGSHRRGIFGGLQDWWERDGKEDLKIYAASLTAALLIRTVAIEPRYIPSLSMFPTFEVGDQLAVEKLSVKFSRPYQRKDVVVFYPPPKFREFSDLGEQEALIKRVIAVDGDVVEIKDGTLVINGEEQLEEYVFEEPEYKWGPQTVPQGMVMVLGDNRNHSLDSHVWGFLPRENVIGRAVFKYWPPWRAGPVEGGR